MSRVGDAAGAEALALTYERGAASLVEQMRHLETRLAGSHWEGVAARQTRESLRDRAQRCEQASHEMQQLASELRRYARQVQERENQLRRLERRIRAWVMANPPSPDRWPNASLVHRYPAPLDPAWDDLARRLRLSGAVF